MNWLQPLDLATTTIIDCALDNSWSPLTGRDQPLPSVAPRKSSTVFDAPRTSQLIGTSALREMNFDSVVSRQRHFVRESC